MPRDRAIGEGDGEGVLALKSPGGSGKFAALLTPCRTECCSSCALPAQMNWTASASTITPTPSEARGQDPLWETPHLRKFASCITMATEERCSLVLAKEDGRNGKYSCFLGFQESKTACSWEQQGGEGQDLPQSLVWFPLCCLGASLWWGEALTNSDGVSPATM